MNKNIIIALVVGAVLGGIAWSGLRPASVNQGSIDRHFIEQMIPHHDDAITMAQIALTKATKPEIKTLASAIVEAQTKENNQMRAWYKNWFGQDVPTHVGMMHGSMMPARRSLGEGGSGNTDFSNLETSRDFDRDFIREMIPHHQMAVMMASMMLGSTERPEMKKLGQDIIDAQTREINQMRTWYEAWR